MKKVLALVLSVALIFSVCAFSVSAEGTPTMTVLADKKVVALGDTITLTVSLDQNPGIVSLDTCMKYDSSAFELQSAGTDGFAGASVITSQYLTVNPYIINMVNGVASENYTNTGVIFTYVFKAIAEKAAADFIFAYSDSFDKDFNEISFNVDNSAVKGIAVKAYEYGDVNHDGNIGITDLTLISRALAGWDGYEKYLNRESDVTANNVTNNRDYVVFCRHLASWSGYEKLPYTLGNLDSDGDGWIDGWY